MDHTNTDRVAIAKRKLNEEIDAATAVMLGIVGSTQHFQPMAPQRDPDDGSIWFFTRKSSDLFGAVGQGSQARMIVVGADRDFHACCGGSRRQEFQESKRDQFWSPVVDAWYVDGKHDPDLAMLHLIPSDAAVWVSEKTGMSFAWDVAKANAANREADTGWQAHIRF